MEWEQLEEHWREVKCRIKGDWGVLARSGEINGEDWPLPPSTARRHPSEEADEWRELEESVFKGDLEQLIRDFESSGTHH